MNESGPFIQILSKYGNYLAFNSGLNILKADNTSMGGYFSMRSKTGISGGAMLYRLITAFEIKL